MRGTLRILCAGSIALCSLSSSLEAQSRPLFDTFAYPKPWTTQPGLFKPQPAAVLVEPSPNHAWKKLVWGVGRYWPLVDYLAENVTTSSQGGPSRLILSVTPRPGPGLAAGGAEILADRGVHTFGFGSYRVRMKASPPTPKGVGVVNAFYFYSPQIELDIEFLSVNQARTPGTGQVEMVVHDHVTRPGGRVSVIKYINLPFDPSREFHVYGFDWRPNQAEFYVDDRLVTVIRTGDLGEYRSSTGSQMLPIWMPDATNLVPDAIRMSNWTDMPSWCGAPPSAKTDFEIDWVSYSPSFFTVSTTELSTSTGGRAEFKIDAGPGRAGALALILATPFETDNGLVNPFWPSVILPVEFDWVLLPMVFELARRSHLHGFLSVLDTRGQGAGAFVLQPSQIGPELLGSRLHFACLTLHPFFNIIQGSSNRARVGLAR